jgi:3-hydroxy-9,10-secoandrosta-1,3,5(10)-triene-9,17-dione monooxygenase reductase component
VTIHPEHPFLPPPGEGDPARRLRSRLVAPVTIWAAEVRAPDGRVSRAGFTVGTTTVADGAPSCVLGLIDPESDLWEAVQQSGRFTVSLLQWSDRYLADVFAGLAPAPGGSFGTDDWGETAYGPVLSGRTWAGCRLVDSRAVGYGLLATGAVEEVVVDPSTARADPTGPDVHPDALARLRGRYTPVPAPRR